jgi:V/A-type H+-transporting ATPase subunit I
MNLRPATANWFELLVMRDDLATAMVALAASASVELQAHGQADRGQRPAECRDLIAEFENFERRYARYWPPVGPPQAREGAEPYAMLESALRNAREWARRAAGLITRFEELTHERNELQAIHAMLEHAESLPDLARFSRAGPMLQSRVFRLPDDKWPESLPGAVITERINVSASLDRVTAELADLNREFDIAVALANAQFVRWYAETVPELSATENFAWITGWTSETDGDRLTELLADAGIKGVLRLAEPPPGFEPPLLLRNPRWLRPFEAFTNLLGVPAAGEADPTRILAIVSPLMFAYMFGDVGHGAVLLIAGLILSRRYPALRLLVYGGGMSVVFGFLFGSVFSLETLIAPIWMNPLEDPVLILIIPMVGGAILLLVGMLLDALQSRWSGRGRDWWETGAGLMLCYVSLLAAVIDVRWLWALAACAAWFVVGHAFVVPERRLVAVGKAAAKLLESLLQLIVNTVSFVRVGAFALAHSGLSLAVVGLASATDSLALAGLILVLGNVLIIGLEGLVVSIQTTRLVLFEFFMRFLRAGGRPFRPLAPLH